MFFNNNPNQIHRADVAEVRLFSAYRMNGSVPGIGTITNYRGIPYSEQPVMFRGATSGILNDRIMYPSVRVEISFENGGFFVFDDMILTHRAGQPGDSGAALLTRPISGSSDLAVLGTYSLSAYLSNGQHIGIYSRVQNYN